ncbi:hypothetical protein KL86DES1_20263 [uncultured Desulfovibrio sp.]|uniref:Uncharacterized protein n=1 Tax=uncultured Desulfovibrio sp. TaxID=167968 RepID=A0A212L2Z6_9BACT|nr:hypothetical protein KL86DES1_20263 [uncultured Desulfovibrio sp.]VZH33164.1 conserved protein of unknown function [Desulfovibrio sp. 86]
MICKLCPSALREHFTVENGVTVLEQIKEALIKEPPGNALVFLLARRVFFEAGVDSSVLDCFKKSEASPPNGINQRFPSSFRSFCAK